MMGGPICCSFNQVTKGRVILHLNVTSSGQSTFAVRRRGARVVVGRRGARVVVGRRGARVVVGRRGAIWPQLCTKQCAY